MNLMNKWNNFPDNIKKMIYIGGWVLILIVIFSMMWWKTVEQVCIEEEPVKFDVEIIKSEELLEGSKPVVFDKGVAWKKKVSYNCSWWEKWDVIKEEILEEPKKEIQIQGTMPVTYLNSVWIEIWTNYLNYLQDIRTNPTEISNLEKLISPILKNNLKNWNIGSYWNIMNDVNFNFPVVRWRVISVEPVYSWTNIALLKLTIEKTTNRLGVEDKKTDFLYLHYYQKNWYIIPDNYFRRLSYNWVSQKINQQQIYLEATPEYSSQDLRFNINQILLVWPDKFMIVYKILTAEKFNKLSINAEIKSDKVIWKNWKEEKTEKHSITSTTNLDISQNDVINTNGVWWTTEAVNWVAYSSYTNFFIVEAKDPLYFLENKNHEFIIKMKAENSNNFRLTLPEIKFDFKENL